jgi:Fe-S-cluster containining protein
MEPVGKRWITREGGLRFKCTQCGDCCSSEDGVVLVNRLERERIAQRLKMTVEDFEKMATWPYDDLVRTLRTTSQGCILFDPVRRLCTVYGVHPLQCRTYPFWIGKVGTPERWEKTCKECPGAGTGNFYPADQVKLMANATTRLRELQRMK